MSENSSRPIRAGRFPPLKATVPKWLPAGKAHPPFWAAWAVFDRVYPTQAAVAVNHGFVTEHVIVPSEMRDGMRLHTVPVQVRGWGEVIVAGMIGADDKCGKQVVSVSVDRKLNRELVGLQLSAPPDWGWLDQPQLADLMSTRARVMLLGLVATWANAMVHDLGPSGSVLAEYARRWRYDDGAAVTHAEWWIDLRDPLTWKQ